MTLELSIELYDYQDAAVTEIARNYAAGHKRQILAMPTGSGKTETAGGLMQRLINAGSILPEGTIPYFIVERTVLAQQAAERFEKAGFEVGILQGENTTPRTGREQLMVASIQTLKSRYKLAPDDMGAMVIDEAHILHKRHIELINGLSALLVIGLTATPLRSGLAKLYTVIVRGPSTLECTERGWLVPARCYGPSKPDLDGIKSTAGDYNGLQLAKRVNQPKIIADIVSTWQRLGENRQTICFAVNIAHAEAIALDFRAEDIPAAVIHHKTPPDEESEIRRQFEAGELRVICSVTKLSTGFDSPIASCAILARPTKSEILHVQMNGRVLRTHEASGKTDALILDHSGNIERFGRPVDFELPTELDEGELEKRAKQKNRDLPETRPCTKCAYMVERMTINCPNCGHVIRRPNLVEVADGRLVDVDTPEGAAEKDEFDSRTERKRMLGEFKSYAEDHDYKPGWVSNQYRKMYGCWPEFGTAPSVPTSPATIRWIKKQNQAYARRKAYAQRAMASGAAQ